MLLVGENQPLVALELQNERQFGGSDRQIRVGIDAADVVVFGQSL
jgi:hypothetical protein